MTPLERAMSRIAVLDSGCWLWLGCTNKGYARMNVGGKIVDLHRWMYQQANGPLPPQAQLDHTCHTNDEECQGGYECSHRRCVNPDHLEPVTARENSIRGRGAPGRKSRQVACVNGHAFDESNTYRAPDGTRHCRRCRADVEARRRAMRRALR